MIGLDTCRSVLRPTFSAQIYTCPRPTIRLACQPDILLSRQLLRDQYKPKQPSYPNRREAFCRCPLPGRNTYESIVTVRTSVSINYENTYYKNCYTTTLQKQRVPQLGSIMHGISTINMMVRHCAACSGAALRSHNISTLLQTS